MRVALIGDIGGHVSVLEDCLRSLGVGPDYAIPGDLVIVQVGDLVRCTTGFLRGNRECVALAGHLLARNGGHRYVQLAGNHESAALGGPCRSTWVLDECVDDDIVSTLKSWWATGDMVLAHPLVQVTSADASDTVGDVLVTHAGLTAARWDSLGSPRSVIDAARLVNRDVGAPMAQVSRAGSLISGEVGEMADTMWAEVNREFYLPWLGRRDAPFVQIHGHASPFNWATGSWWPDTPLEVRGATEISHQLRRTRTRFDNGFEAVSIDWMLGDGAPPPRVWEVLVLTHR